MNKQPKLWEILTAFLPIIIGITVWLWNLGTKVERQSAKIEYLEQNQAEYKSDIKKISDKLETILIRMENKADKK